VLARAGAPSPYTASAAAAAAVGETGAAGGAEARDHAMAMRMQEACEEAERASRKAVRQAAARLQQQQEKGAGGMESSEVRDFVAKVETHVADNCSLQ